MGPEFRAVLDQLGGLGAQVVGFDKVGGAIDSVPILNVERHRQWLEA